MIFMVLPQRKMATLIKAVSTPVEKLDGVVIVIILTEDVDGEGTVKGELVIALGVRIVPLVALFPAATLGPPEPITT